MLNFNVAFKRRTDLYWFTIQASTERSAFKKLRTMRNGEYRYSNPYAFYPTK